MPHQARHGILCITKRLCKVKSQETKKLAVNMTAHADCVKCAARAHHPWQDRCKFASFEICIYCALLYQQERKNILWPVSQERCMRRSLSSYPSLCGKHVWACAANSQHERGTLSRSTKLCFLRVCHVDSEWYHVHKQRAVHN